MNKHSTSVKEQKSMDQEFESLPTEAIQWFNEMHALLSPYWSARAALPVKKEEAA